MRKSRFLVAIGLVSLVAVSCAPATPSTTPAAPSSNQGAAAQGQSSPRQAAPAAATMPQRQLVMAVRGEPPTVASLELVAFSGSLQQPRELFNGTLDIRDERERTVPVLAEKLPELNTDAWRVFPDGRMETTYTLKPNLTWHDGTALSAEDFAFAYRVYATPDFGQSTTPPLGMMEGVEAPDPRTVVIRWRQPYPDATSLAHDFQALPRHILEADFQALDPIAFTNLPFWSMEYVGLGPYRLTKWEPGAFIEGAAFDNYALGRPKIDQIKVVFMTDPQTALANVLAGEVHMVADFVFGATEGSTIEQQWAPDNGGTVLWSPVAQRITLVQQRPEHVEHPALLNVQVRRAIRHGFDVPSAAEITAAGKAVQTWTATSPGVEYYPVLEKAIEKYSLDPRRAQEIMEQAGFRKGPDGFFLGANGQPIRFSMTTSSGERQESEGAVYVDGLRKAGFDVHQEVVSVQLIRDPKNRALIPGLQNRGGAWSPHAYTSDQIPRPENRWHGNNRGGWRSAEYDRLVPIWETTLDKTERVNVLAEIERVINQDAALIPLMFNANVNPHVAALKGPVARHTPYSGGPFLHVHKWEWVS
jgi:peptide/nickel transport system substrate-binding protein